MIVMGTEGVRYWSKGQFITASEAKDIPQEIYDAMSPWERYCLLAYFADQGDAPRRYE